MVFRNKLTFHEKKSTLDMENVDAEQQCFSFLPRLHKALKDI